MKKTITLVMAFVMVLSLVACTQQGREEPVEEGIDLSKMKAICELAVMDCYYHDVAKFLEKDAEGVWIWKKDKHFWVEYDGVVTLGIDAARVNPIVEGTNITITLPMATVQSHSVVSETLTKDSFIVDKDSADIVAEDEVYAFAEAQKQLLEIASKDKLLLESAQQRAKELLTQYIENFGEAKVQEYHTNWILLDAEGNPSEIEGPESEPTTEGIPHKTA